VHLFSLLADIFIDMMPYADTPLLLMSRRRLTLMPLRPPIFDAMFSLSLLDAAIYFHACRCRLRR